MIRANNPIPSQCKLFYFEVDIINIGKNGYVVGQIFFISQIESILSKLALILELSELDFVQKKLN